MMRLLTENKCCDVQGHLEGSHKEIQDTENQPGLRKRLRKDDE